MKTEIQPIINGSANPRLTAEMFKKIQSFETKRSVVWNIMNSMSYPHSFKGINPDCFVKPDIEYSVDQINEDNVDDLFIEVRAAFDKHHTFLLRETMIYNENLGKQIWKSQKELGFGGFITMDVYRLRGYIQAHGSFNYFNASRVKSAVVNLHLNSPRIDYGPNNPNTGNIMHEFKVKHSCEYIIMEFNHVTGNDAGRVSRFYENYWEPIGKSINADEIMIDIKPVDGYSNYFSIELVMWWD